MDEGKNRKRGGLGKGRREERGWSYCFPCIQCNTHCLLESLAVGSLLPPPENDTTIIKVIWLVFEAFSLSCVVLHCQRSL